MANFNRGMNLLAYTRRAATAIGRRASKVGGSAGRAATQSRGVVGKAALAISATVSATALATMYSPVHAKSKKDSFTAIKARTEELYEQRDHLTTIKEAEEFLKNHPQSSAQVEAELRWRQGRAYYKLASMAQGDEKKSLVMQGYDKVRVALLKDPDNWAVQKWNGILLSDVSAFEGTKKQIEKAFQIRAFFDRAVELSANDPSLNGVDPTCTYLVGQWCFSIADISWLTRKAAEAFFATPPESSFAEALEYFERAEAAQPGFYKKNRLMMAKSYHKLGDKAKAKHWAEQAIESKVIDKDDEDAHAEALKLLKKLS